MQGEIKIFKQGQLTFILSDQKVTVRTSLGQTFYLKPRAHFWTRRLRLIYVMITLGEIRNLNDLASWGGHGIEWQTTSRQYDLDNLEAVR